MAKLYEVTHVQHFINGRLVQPGEVVELPKGVEPGRYLKPVGGSKSKEADEETTPRFTAKHHSHGDFKVIDENGEQVGELFAADPDDKEKAKAAAQAEAERLNAAPAANLPDA